MEILNIKKLGVKDAFRAQGEESLNILRSIRKDLLCAFDVYKSNVNFGILPQTEQEIQTVVGWYKKLLDLKEEAFYSVPSQVAKYL